MKHTGTATTQPLSSGDSPVLRKKLLIADDDPSIRDIFRIIFEDAGYELELKSGGEDILENKFQRPDLFIIDKQLSGHDGLDICRYLKEQPQTCDIPVIIISASPDIPRLSKEAGADDYLEKPFEIKELLQLVKKHISENHK